MPRLLRVLPMAAAILVLVATAFLPWIDSGSAEFARAVRDRPGYEDAEARLAREIPPKRGLATELGPLVAAAAGTAWALTLAAHLLAGRGRLVRARQAVAGAFALFLLAAILVATTLLRGPGAPMPTTVGVEMVPRFDVGIFAALGGAVLGAVLCGLVIAKSPLPRRGAPA